MCIRDRNHVAEIFIITDMGGLQHFQMGELNDKKLKYKEKLRENKSVMRKKDSSPFLDYKKCLKCEL